MSESKTKRAPQWITLIKRLCVLAERDRKFNIFFEQFVQELYDTGRVVRKLDWFIRQIRERTDVDENFHVDEFKLTKRQLELYRPQLAEMVPGMLTTSKWELSKKAKAARVAAAKSAKRSGKVCEKCAGSCGEVCEKCVESCGEVVVKTGDKPLENKVVSEPVSSVDKVDSLSSGPNNEPASQDTEETPPALHGADAPDVAASPSSHYSAGRHSAPSKEDAPASRRRKQAKTTKGVQISIWNDFNKFGRAEVEINGWKYFANCTHIKTFGDEFDKIESPDKNWKATMLAYLQNEHRTKKNIGVSALYREWDGKKTYSDPALAKILIIQYDSAGTPVGFVVDDLVEGMFLDALKPTGKAGPHFDAYVKEPN